MYQEQKQEKEHFYKTLTEELNIQIIRVHAYEVQIFGYWVRGWAYMSYFFMSVKCKQNKVKHYKQKPIEGQQCLQLLNKSL